MVKTMPDYIAKEQAWEIVKIVSSHADGRSIALADKALADMPAADVAPVVRCKDCVGKKACDIWGCYLDDDDFCSHGVQ